MNYFKTSLFNPLFRHAPTLVFVYDATKKKVSKSTLNRVLLELEYFLNVHGKKEREEFNLINSIN